MIEYLTHPQYLTVAGMFAWMIVKDTFPIAFGYGCIIAGIHNRPMVKIAFELTRVLADWLAIPLVISFTIFLYIGIESTITFMMAGFVLLWAVISLIVCYFSLDRVIRETK